MIEPFVIFVFLGLFSPGPNVVMLTNSGAQFGLRATLAHLCGVVVGVGIVAAAMGFGLGSFLTTVPQLKWLFKIIAIMWILWMAWKLFKSSASHGNTALRPFTFVEAVLFQWVNPKIWAVTIAAVAYVVHLPPSAQALKMGLTFSVLNFGVGLFWILTGDLLSRLLRSERAWAIFRTIMAALLAASAGLLLV